MKRLIALLLAATMTISLAACGGSGVPQLPQAQHLWKSGRLHSCKAVVRGRHGCRFLQFRRQQRACGTAFLGYGSSARKRIRPGLPRLPDRRGARRAKRELRTEGGAPRMQSISVQAQCAAEWRLIWTATAKDAKNFWKAMRSPSTGN